MSGTEKAMEALSEASYPRACASAPIGPLPALDDLILFLEGTAPQTWWPGPTYRSPDGSQHCVLSQVHHHFGADAMTIFEEVWATVAVIGQANDGKHPDYPQGHPRDRSVAFLRALRDGREETTGEAMVREGSI